MMWFIRCMLWVALVSTTAFFGLLLYMLPSYGDVAQFMEFFVGAALAMAWVALWAETEETMELNILLERLAASRK